MNVLVVIPCLNEEAHIEALLKQLLEDLVVGLIVVADGGSTDGTLGILDSYADKTDRIHIIHNPAKIQSAGINQAVAEFGNGYDVLLRVDAHCLYPDNYAAKVLDALEKNKADCVVVPMLTIGRTRFQYAVAAAQNSVLGTGGSAHRHLGDGCFVEHGHHALMKLSLFRQVGGYCEAMPCNEDAELDFRLVAKGAKIWLEPKAAIEYFPRSTPKALWRQYFRYGVGRACNIRRNRMRPRLRQVLPLAVPLAVIVIPLTYFHWIFALPSLAWFVLCLGLGAVIGFKSGHKWGVLAGVAAAIMHLAWGLGFFWEFISRPSSVKPKYGLLET